MTTLISLQDDFSDGILTVTGHGCLRSSADRFKKPNRFQRTRPQSAKPPPQHENTNENETSQQRFLKRPQSAIGRQSIRSSIQKPKENEIKPQNEEPMSVAGKAEVAEEKKKTEIPSGDELFQKSVLQPLPADENAAEQTTNVSQKKRLNEYLDSPIRPEDTKSSGSRVVYSRVKYTPEPLRSYSSMSVRPRSAYSVMENFGRRSISRTERPASAASMGEKHTVNISFINIQKSPIYEREIQQKRKTLGDIRQTLMKRPKSAPSNRIIPKVTPRTISAASLIPDSKLLKALDITQIKPRTRPHSAPPKRSHEPKFDIPSYLHITWAAGFVAKPPTRHVRAGFVLTPKHATNLKKAVKSHRTIKKKVIYSI